MDQQLNPNYIFLHKNWAKYKFFLLQGSTRSGKTYSIIDFIIFICNKYKKAGIEFDICRDSLPILKATVLKDFTDRLNKFGLYNEHNHNMTEKVYNLFGNYIYYYSADDEMKMRGRKRNIFWYNEPNNASKEIIRQVLFRTSHKAIFDFNPSEPVGEEHWLYDDIMQRNNACHIITTYKDNPYLTKEQVEEIERLRSADPEYYKVFGLGERAALGDCIFNHYIIADQIQSDDFCYGVDFGYNDPFALTKVSFKDNCVQVKQLHCQSQLITTDIIKILIEKVDRNKAIWADSADPKTIEEIRRAGFNIRSADKGTIMNRINKIKSKPLYIHPESTELIRELKNYRFKTNKNGVKIDEPVDYMNHLIDSMSYCIWNHQMNYSGNIICEIF